MLSIVGIFYFVFGRDGKEVIIEIEMLELIEVSFMRLDLCFIWENYCRRGGYFCLLIFRE